jgi:hypothetical protein
VNEAVIVAALAVGALNLVAALVGALRWYQGEPSRAFWLLLRLAQASGFLLAVAAGVLAATGRKSSDGLFYLYAVLPVAVAFVAEQLRLTSAQTVLDQRGLADAQAVGELPEAEQHLVVGAIMRRELGVMALSAAVIVFLAVRAAATAHGL